MEELIKQAFLHVDVIGPHVQEGHYDLIGPNGEIILPQVWETMIEPDWSITMHMWPMPEPKPGPGPLPGHHFHPGERRPGSRGHPLHSRGPGVPGPPPSGHRGGPGPPPPPPAGWPGPRPGGPPGGHGVGGPPVVVVRGSPPPRSRRKPEQKGVFDWITGSSKPAPKSSKGMSCIHSPLLGTD